MHDILTGSRPDGTAFGGDADRTCANWTSSGAGAAIVGHSDRTGPDEGAPMKSWNSSHPSRGPGGGCSQDDLKSTGGMGLIYCFAADWRRVAMMETRITPCDPRALSGAPC